MSVTPTNADAVYAKIDLWVRKDNYVPLKWVMFDKKSTTPVKTLLAMSDTVYVDAVPWRSVLVLGETPSVKSGVAGAVTTSVAETEWLRPPPVPVIVKG